MRGLALFSFVALAACSPPMNDQEDAKALEDALAADAIADGSVNAGSESPPHGSESDPADAMTGPQRNALRSARDYINMAGFSRAGLIEQLSSEYGSGYDVGDATAAVDSMGIDWNEQAARSARDYLEMQGFSCNGLIEQLSSEYGSRYTRSQAEFGARQAGAC